MADFTTMCACGRPVYHYRRGRPKTLCDQCSLDHAREKNRLYQRKRRESVEYLKRENERVKTWQEKHGTRKAKHRIWFHATV